MRLAIPIRLAIAVCAAMALGGCTNLSGLSGSSSYACKAPEGVTCDSVAGTYANALQSNLPSQRSRKADAKATQPAASSPLERIGPNASALITGLPPTPLSLRSSPRILRLWFKPWEDADHDLYDQGYVYVQVDGGQWQIEHVQRQIRETYAPIKAPPRATSPDANDKTPLPANLRSLPRPASDGSAPGPQLPAPAPRDTDPTE
jgi:conjugal transfer pilus assembly protein TraV